MSKHICSKNKRNEKEASCILHWHGPNRYKNGKIYTGRPRLVRELCPKKPRTNQNRTNQECTKRLL